MKRIALLIAATMTLSACGPAGDESVSPPEDPDTPVLQVESEGGFAPVEVILGQGPRYTLLADGRLIYEGPQILVYPGPLLPNYQVTSIDNDQMGRVLDLIDEIGLPEMDHEIDDSASSRVADATTEVVTYWDEAGEHSYAVYALGIEVGTPPPPTRAFAELVDLLGRLSAEGEDLGEYQPDRVVIMAGVGLTDPDFEDVREWPLDNEDFSEWETLPNGWMCSVHGADVLDLFRDATKATQWRWVPGDPTHDAELFTLTVRPLHPGEPGCPDA